MPTRTLLIALTLVGAGACTTAEATPDPLEVALQSLVDSVAASGSPGALLYAYRPSTGLEWSGAAGLSDVDAATPASPEQTFRNASNTKTYTAAAVLRLWETGRLDLDAPLRDFVTGAQADLLSSDGYDLDAITLRHLLTHTGGLIDHGSVSEYFATIMTDPTRRWTRDDQLAGAVEWGDPLGPSGESFSYSDTGYILLGQVVEFATGQPLGPAVRDLLDSDGLGLDATWWEIMEPTPETAGSRLHQYVDGADTYTWDASLDSYGGGGLVTSTRDLGTFWYALFAGSVFDQSATLDTMLTTPLPEAETPYRMGIFVREIDGLRAYGHSGFWGTRALYVPELDLVVAAAVTEQTLGSGAFVLTNRAVQLISDFAVQP